MGQGGCSMATRQELVEGLVKKGTLKDEKIQKAFLSVDLLPFLPEQYRKMAYEDRPIPFYDNGNIVRTISTPHIIATLLQSLQLKDGLKILILGSKSGYIEALIASTVKVSKVRVVDMNTKICTVTKKNLGKNYPVIQVASGDPAKGYAKEKPFDRIVITGQIDSLPDMLMSQLGKGGFIIAPVGNVRAQKLLKITIGGKTEEMMDVVFGPLEMPKRKLGKKDEDVMTYEKVMEQVWSDGMITPEESAMLDQLRKRLKIDAAKHLELESKVRTATPKRTDVKGHIDVEWYIERLQTELQKGENGMAKAVFEEIMQLQDKIVDVWICKSVAFHMVGLLAQSIGCLDEALKLDRKDKLVPPTVKLLLDTIVNLNKDTCVKLKDPKTAAKERKELMQFKKMQEDKVNEYADYLLELNPEDEGAMNAKLGIKFRDTGMDGYA